MHKRPIIDGKLRCKICTQWKDIETEFSRDKNGYVHSYCNKCRHEGYIKVRESVLAHGYQRRSLHKDEINARKRELSWKLRLELIEAYGGRCVCCGENRSEFLTIDHIHNDGSADKRRGTRLYAWLRRMNFPTDNYQLLCWNCNAAKAYFGICPHQKELGVDNA